MSETPTAPQDSRLHEQRLRGVWAEAFQTDSLVHLLDALYDHEINVGLQSFWDNGWDVWFGDEMNGKRAERHFEPYESGLMLSWLKRTAEDYYPSLKRGRLMGGNNVDV